MVPQEVLYDLLVVGVGEEAGHHHRRPVVVVPAVDDRVLPDQQLDVLVVADLGREVEGAHLGPVLVVDVHRVAQEESGGGRWFLEISSYVRVTRSSCVGVQGDTSRSSKPIIDIDLKVAF